MHRLAKNLLALALGLAVAALAAELCLRVYYPFPFRVKNSGLVLPIHAHYTIATHVNAKLDPVVTHTKNSLGFRGPEPPGAGTPALRIITVGGSTTECFYISDGKTWPDLLLQHARATLGPQVWLNNAGLDGHSTRGHILLVGTTCRCAHPAHGHIMHMGTSCIWAHPADGLILHMGTSC